MLYQVHLAMSGVICVAHLYFGLFVFILCLVYPMLPVSLYYLFLIYDDKVVIFIIDNNDELLFLL
jgi:hypothetical protein